MMHSPYEYVVQQSDNRQELYRKGNSHTMDGTIHRHSHRPAGFLASAPAVPYLIDATSSSTGRHIKPTKHRVEFRFGFASFSHLALGYQGHECRGSEHQVTLLWSLLSGKRRVILDGRDVYFRHAPNLSAQQFSHSFVIPGLNHNLQLVADYSGHFNLSIDGQSVFEMLRIYQLGRTECKRLYAHVYAYATRVPRAELEKALTMGTSHSNIKRVEQDNGEVDSLSDDDDWENLTHLDPRDVVEEKKMYSMARHRSLRNGQSPAFLRSSLSNIDECREEQVDLIDLSGGGSLHRPHFATAAPDDNVSVLGDDASSVGGWGTGPTLQVPSSYVAPPAPTWEQTRGDFGGMNAAASPLPPSSRTRMHSLESSSVSGWGTGPNVPSVINAPPPPTWEQTQRAFGRSVPPSSSCSRNEPPSVAVSSASGWGTGPNVPSVINAPPPPTWEQTRADFGWGVPPPSGRNSNQPPSVAVSSASGWGTGPNVPSVINAPPPPTWEQTQADFGWGSQSPSPTSVTSSYIKY